MLVDTSGLLAFLDRSESRHEQAAQHVREAPVLLLHNYVIAEMVALATSRRLPRERTLAFLRAFAAAPIVDFVHVGESVHDVAMTLLEQRLDKHWSLCDAVSFILMAERNVTDALTTDQHFEQAGFHRLLV